VNKQTKGIIAWFKNLKTSHKIMLILGVLFVLITGTAMCATCGQ